MAQKGKTNQTKLILDAALALAEKSGWASLTKEKVAAKAKVKAAAVPDIPDILKAVLERLAMETQKIVAGHLGDDPKDNLIEILMTRFDLAARHRAAYAAIPAYFRQQPKQARHFVRLFFKTIKNILSSAGYPATPLHVVAFGAVYASIVDVWIKDDSRDGAKTLAALDKRIDMFEKALKYISCPQ